MMKLMIRFLFVLIFLITAAMASVTSLYGQDFVTGPSTNGSDAKSTFGNPSLLSYMPSGLSMGIRGYQLGLMENNYRHYDQYLMLNFRQLMSGKWSGALHVMQQETPLLNRSSFGTSLSYRFTSTLSAGAQLSLLHFSYNTSDFDLVDSGDPVFSSGSSQTTWNTSFGLTYKPTYSSTLSAGLRNGNRPRISPGESAYKLPRELFVGGSYSFGSFRGLMDIRWNDLGLKSHFYAEVFSSEGHYLRMGADDTFEIMELDLQVNTQKDMHINYQMQYPLNDVGSLGRGTHLIGVRFNLNRPKPTPKMRDIPVTELAFNWPVEIPAPAMQFIVKAENEHVNIKEVEIVYDVDENISDERLSGLTLGDLPSANAETGALTRPFTERSMVPSAPRSIEMSKSYSDTYNRFLDQITEWAQSEKDRELNLVAPGTQKFRAAGLRNRITTARAERVYDGAEKAGAVVIQELSDAGNGDSEGAEWQNQPVTRERLQNQRTTFFEPSSASISVILSNASALSEWALIIENDQSSRVRTISGTGAAPERIEWDWTTDRGVLVEPGVYTYYLEASDRGGNVYRSNKRVVYVQKVHRKITIKISEIPDNLDELLEQFDEVDLILKNE